MRLLVTGGAGFIGSNFIRFMLHKHPAWSIVNLDKLTYAGNLDNLRDVEKNPRYKFVKGDICDRRIVGSLAQKTDVIINFAAETHVDRSIQEPGGFVQTNVYGTYVLLEAARKFKHKKYLQISTDEVYGSIDKGSFNEKSQLHPNSPYSAAKASADLMVLSYFRTFGLPVLITRCTNNYGSYQYPEKLISLSITNVLEGKPIFLYGDGMNVRDWIYVEDHCAGVDFILQKGKPGEIYNLGGGQEMSNLDISREILRQLARPEKTIQYIKDRPGHDRRYSLDCSKVKKIGFKPRYSFSESIALTVEWYKQETAWWKKIKSGEFKKYYEKMYGKR